MHMHGPRESESERKRERFDSRSKPYKKLTEYK